MRHPHIAASWMSSNLWRALVHQQVLPRGYVLPGVSRMSPYGCFWLAATNPMDVTAAVERIIFRHLMVFAMSAGVHIVLHSAPCVKKLFQELFQEAWTYPTPDLIRTVAQTNVEKQK